jgi:hypothetical protein
MWCRLAACLPSQAGSPTSEILASRRRSLSWTRPPDFDKVTRMKARIALFCVSILVSAAMSGWGSGSPAPEQSLCGPYPKLYKEIVWKWLENTLIDANSAKIEWEGEPKCVDMAENGKHLYGWLVSFSINSRNRFGSYTGKQKHGALIRDGEVIKGTGFGY